MLFRQGSNPLESFTAVPDSVSVTETVSIAEHGNDVWNSLFRCQRNRLLELANEHLVTRGVVESVAQKILSLSRISHRRDQAMLPHYVPFGGLQQIDRSDPHRFACIAKLGKWNRRIRPARYRLLEAPFAHWLGRACD